MVHKELLIAKQWPKESGQDVDMWTSVLVHNLHDCVWVLVHASSATRQHSCLTVGAAGSLGTAVWLQPKVAMQWFSLQRKQLNDNVY